MTIKTSSVGIGYAGLVSETCFAKTGIILTGNDIDKYKIENLKKGMFPISEPALESMVWRNIEKERLLFTTNQKANFDRKILFTIILSERTFAPNPAK